jgi:cytochrome c-type biogenesis protein CcmH/NrfG
VGLGYIYSKTGRHDAAVQALQRALALDPSNIQAQDDLKTLQGGDTKQP